MSSPTATGATAEAASANVVDANCGSGDPGRSATASGGTGTRSATTARPNRVRRERGARLAVRLVGEAGERVEDRVPRGRGLLDHGRRAHGGGTVWPRTRGFDHLGLDFIDRVGLDDERGTRHEVGDVERVAVVGTDRHGRRDAVDRSGAPSTTADSSRSAKSPKENAPTSGISSMARRPSSSSANGSTIAAVTPADGDGSSVTWIWCRSDSCATT